MDTKFRPIPPTPTPGSPSRPNPNPNPNPNPAHISAPNPIPNSTSTPVNTGASSPNFSVAHNPNPPLYHTSSEKSIGNASTAPTAPLINSAASTAPAASPISSAVPTSQPLTASPASLSAPQSPAASIIPPSQAPSSSTPHKTRLSHRLKSLARPQLITLGIIGVILITAASFSVWFFLLRPDNSKLSANVRSNFWSAKKLQIGGSLVFDLPRPRDQEYYIKQIKTTPRILSSPVPYESYANFSVGLIGSDNAAYSFAFNARRTSDNVLELTLVDTHAIIPLLEKIKPSELPNLNRRTSVPLAKWAQKYNRTPLKIDLSALAKDQSDFAGELRTLACGLDRLNNFSAKRADLANLYNDDPFLSLGGLASATTAKPSKSTKSSTAAPKIADYHLKINSAALTKFATPLTSTCDPAPSKSIQSLVSQLDLSAILPQIFTGNLIGVVNRENEHLIKIATTDKPKQELVFTYDKFTLPAHTNPTTDWLPDLIQAYKNYQALASSSSGDLIDDYIPLDKNCNVYQGVDPTDRCYKPGCGSSIERDPNPACLPKKR